MNVAQDPWEMHQQDSPSCPLVILQTQPQDYEKCLAARIETFKNWSIHIDKQAMANAGWIYDPMSDSTDNTVCFDCQLGLDGWQIDDNPL